MLFKKKINLQKHVHKNSKVQITLERFKFLRNFSVQVFLQTQKILKSQKLTKINLLNFNESDDLSDI